MGEDATPASRRSNWLERRLAVPVLIAALLSIPAVSLTLWGEGRAAQIGAAINWLAGLVLWVEWLLLIAFAENRWSWLREHKWATLVVLLTVPAVVFTVGPAQALRLLHLIGTLRLVRVTRLIEAGSVLGRRMGLTGTPRRLLLSGTTVLAAAFAALILADPNAESRRLAAALLERVGTWPALLGGTLLLAAAGGVAYRWFRRSHRPGGGRADASDPGGRAR